LKAILGTKKGVLLMEQSAGSWHLKKAHFDAIKSSYVTLDKRTNIIWAGINHGHWGPKLHFSKDEAESFQEVSTPKFPEGSKHSFGDFWCLTSDSKDRLYLGASPVGLFYSDDFGETWTPNESLENIKGQDQWFGGGVDDTCLHSIIIHPEDLNRIMIGISVAGCIETKDRGLTWQYMNKGMKARYLPDENAEIGQDPHLLKAAPSDSNILWQQNHCGIFISRDFGGSWVDLSKKPGLKSSFGWGVQVDEKNPDIAYTIPALSDELRVPVDKSLFVQKTTDGGENWMAITNGLPQGDCYDIVYRHAFSMKGESLMFGTTTGNLYYSADKGESWELTSTHMPPIYSLDFL